MRKDFMVTSESVTVGHPDKLCDRISDAIIDRFLTQDPHARIRAQCAVSSAIIFIAARFSSKATVDVTHVARKTIKQAGYDRDDISFSAKNCSILTTANKVYYDQKYDFNENELTDEDIEKFPSKHQVSIFGFACDQTPTFMPLPIHLAHKIARQLDRVRIKEILPGLLPDGRVQVGVEYSGHRPGRIHSVNITTTKKNKSSDLHDNIIETVIGPAFEDEEIKPDNNTRIFINPEGPSLEAPHYHSGLAGRKNAVDTYGEYCRHSGKALSGKDPLRIDRVAAYAARYAAKNVVAAGLASECEIMLSYSIGLTRPVSLYVETFGTSEMRPSQLTEIVERNFDFRLGGILRDFNLRHLPQINGGMFYRNLSTYGHFGRTDISLPWEKTDKAEVLSGEV
ncbi:S-adenosylmethionine synthase [Candidatus Magnetomoraceae bacterium gMMP-1]